MYFIIGSQSPQICVVPCCAGSQSPSRRGLLYRLCSLVKPGWNGIEITYQKPTTDHQSTVFITSAVKIIKTTSLCWTPAFNCMDQQWIHFSWVWLKVSSMTAGILSNKQKVLANPQKLELTQTCFMVSKCVPVLHGARLKTLLHDAVLKTGEQGVLNQNFPCHQEGKTA